MSVGRDLQSLPPAVLSFLMAEHYAVYKFRQYVRIKSISSEGTKGSYLEATNFLQSYLSSVGITQFQTIEFVKGKPVLIASWPGSDPALPSILLNSHYDVVPADPAKWKHEPFSAVLEEGKIYGRGTQDMKCVTIQYIEAIGRLKRAVSTGLIPPLKRTIHLSFLPDEEVAGMDGAMKFVVSKEFKALNIGMTLDEGLANPDGAYKIFYGERAPWRVKISASGPAGHGSRFIPRFGTSSSPFLQVKASAAIEKLNDVITKIYKFRAQQQALLHPSDNCEGGCSHSLAKKLGDVVTVNVTALKAFVPGPEQYEGFAINVIPTEAVAAMDIRIPPTFPLEDMEKILQEWTQEEGLSYSFYTKMPSHHITTADETNPWWVAVKNSLASQGKEIEPEIFPAATDSRLAVLRTHQGQLISSRLKPLQSALRFSPIRNTPILLHDHNEHLAVSVFLEGIDVYQNLIKDVANC